MGGCQTHPPEQLCKRSQLDTMSRIFTFRSQKQADLLKEQLQNEQKREKDNHLHILEMRKIRVEESQVPEWKVAVLFQFPQWSLRSFIIQMKRDQQYLPLETVFQLLSLFSEFLFLYKHQLCDHFDIFSSIFANENGFKICCPSLLYSACNKGCALIDKQILIKQVLEMVLLQKIIVMDYWSLLDKIQKIYPDSQLYSLFSFIMQTQTSLEGILLRYQIKENQQTKEQEIDNLAQLSEAESQTKIVSENSEPFFFNLTPITYPQNHLQPHRGILNGTQKCSQSMIKQQQQEQNNSEEGSMPSSNQKSKLITINPFSSHGYTYSYQEEINNIQEDLQAKTEKYIRMNEAEGNYEGYIVDGFKEGEGVLQYFNGAIYKGYWSNNRKNGYGQLFCPNIFVYNGYWKDDLKHGKGQLLNLNVSAVPSDLTFKNLSNIFEVGCWKSYTGLFTQNKLEGEGQLSLSNGDKWIGNWRQNKIWGKGQYVSSFGKKIQGLWDQGELISSLKSSQSSASICENSDFEFS